MALVLVAALWGVLSRVGPLGFALGFVPSFAVLIGLSWSGRFDRFVPAALATLLVAAWPLYRWMTYGEVKTVQIYLLLAGYINLFLLGLIALEFAKRRSRVDESATRRRISHALLSVPAVAFLVGWPTGAWRSALIGASLVVVLCVWFWPSRSPKTPSNGHAVGI